MSVYRQSAEETAAVERLHKSGYIKAELNDVAVITLKGIKASSSIAASDEDDLQLVSNAYGIPVDVLRRTPAEVIDRLIFKGDFT